TPATISAPPTSWIGSGSSPRNSHAANTAQSTSDSPTKLASRDPSRRVAAMPVAYASAVDSSTIPDAGTAQCTCRSRNTTSWSDTSSGISPTSPTASNANAATTIPADAIARGGSPSGSRADSTKYTTTDTAAASAHATPIGSTSTEPVTSSTSTSPPTASAVPPTVTRLGREPWRSHNHPIISTGARYSSSS